MRKVLDPPHPPWRDIRAERDRYRRFSRRGTESEDNHRRVRFVRGTNGHAQRRREDQAARDFAEENRDQRYLNNAKRHARHQVHEGGGAFEIDGHYSGDYLVQCEAKPSTLDAYEQADMIQTHTAPKVVLTTHIVCTVPLLRAMKAEAVESGPSRPPLMTRAAQAVPASRERYTLGSFPITGVGGCLSIVATTVFLDSCCRGEGDAIPSPTITHEVE